MKCTCVKAKVIHITEIRQDYVESLDLCLECADKYLNGEEIEVNLEQNQIVDDPPKDNLEIPKSELETLKKEFIDKTLQALSDIFGKYLVLEKIEGPPCPVCGITFAEVFKCGKVGCATCWDHFHEKLSPVLKRVQDGQQHRGKVPKNRKKEPMKKTEQIRINALMNAINLLMQDTIQREDYEQAAVLRDALKECRGLDAELELLKGDLETALIQGDPVEEIRAKINVVLDRIKSISSNVLSNFPKLDSTSEDL